MDFSRKWIRYFFENALLTARLSKDPSTQAGCVIVNPTTKHILAHGFNGFARGVADFEERYNDRDLKYIMIVHAEMNAVSHAAFNGISLADSIAFVTFPVCARCAAVLIQAGVKEVCWLEADPSKPTSAEWQKLNSIAMTMLIEAGVDQHIFKPSELGV